MTDCRFRAFAARLALAVCCFAAAMFPMACSTGRPATSSAKLPATRPAATRPAQPVPPLAVRPARPDMPAPVQPAPAPAPAGPTVRPAEVAKPAPKPAVTQPAGEVSTRTYDVRDLLVSQPDFEGPGLGWQRSTQALPTTRPAPMDPAGRLVETIKAQVFPGSWDDAAAISELNGQLVVAHAAQAHEQLAALLKRLRARRDLQFVVEIRLVGMPAGEEKKVRDFLAGRPGVEAQAPAKVWRLGPGDNRKFMETTQAIKSAQVLSAPTVVVANGQHAYIQVGSETVVEIPVSGKKNQTIARPFLSGLGLAVRVEGEAGEAPMSLDLRLEQASVDRVGGAVRTTMARSTLEAVVEEGQSLVMALPPQAVRSVVAREITDEVTGVTGVEVIESPLPAPAAPAAPATYLLVTAKKATPDKQP